MLNYPPVPVRRKQHWLKDAPWGSIFVIAGLFCVTGVIAYEDLNTATEEVTPREPLTIERGYLMEVPTRSIGVQGMLEASRNRNKIRIVFDDGGRKEWIVSYAKRMRTGYQYCIYSQQHLLRTVSYETRESFSRSVSFEGIREPNADDSCPLFPVD